MDIKQNSLVDQTAGDSKLPPPKPATKNSPLSFSEILVRTMNKDLEALSKGNPLSAQNPSAAPLAPAPKPAPAKTFSEINKTFTPPNILTPRPPAEPQIKTSVPPPDLPVPKAAVSFVETPKAAPLPPPPPPPISEPPLPKPTPVPPPPKPPLPPAAPTILLPKTQTSESSLGKIFLIGGIFLIVALAGGAGWLYWDKIFPPTPITPSTPTPFFIEPLKPAALFNMENQTIIDLGDQVISSLALQDKLKTAFIESSQAAGIFSQVLIKTGSANNQKYEDLNSLLAQLNISLPKDHFAENYSFFIYSQNVSESSSDSSPFNAQPRPRAGLIIELNDPTNEITSLLKQSESTLPQDCSGLLLGENAQIPAEVAFSDNLYQQIAIRYINLPEPTLTLDYAIVDNKLLIATSKESMYAAIDRLLSSTNQGDAASWQTYRNDEYGF